MKIRNDYGLIIDFVVFVIFIISVFLLDSNIYITACTEDTDRICFDYFWYIVFSLSSLYFIFTKLLIRIQTIPTKKK